MIYMQLNGLVQTIIALVLYIINMQEVLELRKGLNELAVIEEMMIGVIAVTIIELALIVLYTWQISTTKN